MTSSAFFDRTIPPGDREIVVALGDAAPRWFALARFLTERIGARGHPRWDGPRYGWSVPFKRAGRTLVTLTPRLAGFDALVVLGVAEADAARGLTLGEGAREVFADSPQLHDGRWLFLTIASDDDVADVLKLLTVKLPARLRARLAAEPQLEVPA